jgi:hypothetical protein
VPDPTDATDRGEFLTRQLLGELQRRLVDECKAWETAAPSRELVLALGEDIARVTGEWERRTLPEAEWSTPELLRQMLAPILGDLMRKLGIAVVEEVKPCEA